MALIKCRKCGKEISAGAVACPDCEFPLKQQQSWMSLSKTKAAKAPKTKKGIGIGQIIFIILVGLLVLGWILSLIGDTD